jgi:hypothetical protein
VSISNSDLLGVVHGNRIEFDINLGFPDGQKVAVHVRPLAADASPPGEGLRRAFGAWSEDAAELDAYLEWNRQQRKLNRREIEP